MNKLDAITKSIEQLAKTAGANLSGEITLLGIFVNKLCPIHTELADRDYILALKAYQERLPIYCTGDLIKENGIFILKNPHHFRLDEQVVI